MRAKSFIYYINICLASRLCISELFGSWLLIALLKSVALSFLLHLQNKGLASEVAFDVHSILLVHQRCSYCFLCFRLYEVKDERHAEAFLKSVSLSNEDAVPLEDRIAALEKKQNSKALDAVKYGPGGSREISFISRSGRRHKEELPSDDEGPKDFKRRGVQSLGLKQGKAEFYMFGGNRGRGRGGARGRGGRGRGGRGRGRG